MVQTFWETLWSHSLLLGLLFDALGKVTLLILLALAGTALLRRASAATRHLIWRTTFAGVVVMFAATLLLPVLNAAHPHIVPALSPVPVWRAPGTRRHANPEQPPALPLDIGSISASALYARRAVSGSVQMEAVPTEMPGEYRLLTGAAALWFAGTLLFLIRAGRRLLSALTLERHSKPITDERVLTLARHISAQLRLPALPRLLTPHKPDSLFSPLTWGSRRACVLLPHAALQWPDARLQAVLKHELAHVQRGDWLAQRCAEVVCALLWFNPLVWRAARHLRATAEQACDDLAVTNGVAPALYAQHLMDIARLLQHARAVPPATLAFLPRPSFESRLRAILDPDTKRGHMSRLVQRSVTLLAALCLAPTALIVPTITRTYAAEVNVPVRALNNKVTLPGGVTVELLGVARIPPAGRLKPSTAWWQVDGTPLAAPPYQSDNLISPLYEGKSACAIGVRTSGLPDRERLTVQDTHPIITAVGVKPHTTTDNTEWNSTRREHDRYANVHTVRVEVSADVTQGTLRYGVASGPWTDAAYDKIETGTDCMLHRDRHNFPTWTWIPSTQKPRGTLRVPQIKTTDSLGLTTRRIMAYTRSGKTRIFNGYWVDAPEGKTEFRVDVPDNIVWSDYRKFQLQTRAYQWAEFPNIAFRPRQSAQAVVPTR